MNNRQINDRHIEALIGETREQAAPAWLKQEIMQCVCSYEPTLWRRLVSWLFQRYTPGLRPTALVFAIVIGCVSFWGGILLERHSTDTMSKNADTFAVFAENGRVHYLAGRELLAAGRHKAALRFLQKAVQLDPGNPEYIHWQGVAYWSVGNKERERQSYFQIVQDHPDFKPSLLNLGHSFLESGNYNVALQYYQRVLQNDRNNPQALYNSALAFEKLNNEYQEKLLLKHYLNVYRTGKWAYRAIDHLQQLGDFTFRSYRIGIHSVVVNVSALLQTGSAAQKKEVEVLANAVNRTAPQELQVVVYNKGNKNESREIALNLRNQILGEIGPEHDAPIMVSWFDTAEIVSFENGEKQELSQSIQIFSNPINLNNGRKST